MNKVFVTKFQPDWDFEPAADYGEVVFLTDDEHRPEPTSPSFNDKITDEIKRGMKDYSVGLDYIVITAAAMPNLVTAVQMAAIKGKHNVLRWNNRKHKYDLFKITIN